ncbi:MAG: GDSL-type esterase/lipase family protein [Clostridiales bacterium]|nr:GDSL-type esterase/lipase family protein [Clostridiales bacterium]
MKKTIKTAVACLLILSFLPLVCRGETIFDIEVKYSALLSLVIASALKTSEPIYINNNYVEGCRYAKPIPDIDIYDTETDPFFENSIFIGDSLMEGFKQYCLYRGEGFLSSPLFITSISLSLKHLLKPLSDSSKHPYFMGEKMLVEDAVAKSGAERVFMIFGTNDMVGLTPEETAAEYNDLIYRIHKNAPDVKIYIIGATYIYSSGQKPGFTNENLRKFNDAMYKYCQNYDYLEFINIGDRLIGADDGLKAEYCSDSYVHMTTEGYDVWVKVLRAYARYFMRRGE